MLIELNYVLVKLCGPSKKLESEACKTQERKNSKKKHPSLNINEAHKHESEDYRLFLP